MNRPVSLGAALAFVGVACGAFGAHTLAESLKLDPKYVETWKTAVFYHLVHALALLLLAAIGDRLTKKAAHAVSALFVAGIALFSGSLYALALTALRPEGPVKILGAITPLGGVCFLAGWATLAIASSRPR